MTSCLKTCRKPRKLIEFPDFYKSQRQSVCSCSRNSNSTSSFSNSNSEHLLNNTNSSTSSVGDEQRGTQNFYSPNKKKQKDLHLKDNINPKTGEPYKRSA